MSQKLQKILEEIKLGTRKNTYDVQISVDEYLQKDENGVSFLEHLFQNNIPINYKDEDNFKNNIEIGYIYCQNNKTLYNFDFTEEDLFSTINEKIFIEFIVEKEKLRQNIIEKVENHLELIDMIISTADFYNLEYLSPKLVKKLITQYPNGLYPIEKYLTNERICKYLMPLINDVRILTYLCTKYNKTEWLRYANKNILMTELSETETVLHSVLNTVKIVPEILRRLPRDIDFINFLRANDFYEYLKQTSEDVFLLKIESNKTLLEDLIEKGYKPKFSGSIWEDETVRILNNNNNLQLVNETKIIESVLLKPSKEVLNIKDHYDRTLLEYLIDNGYEPLNKYQTITKPKIIKILYNKGYYKILGEKLSEEGLLLEIEPGVLIIDKLLENHINILMDSFESVEIAKKFYESNRIDLLAIGDADTLLNNCNTGNTYFDIVLENIKTRNIKYSVTNYKCSDELLAKFYILIAKHDMIDYVNELTEEKLLKKYNDKTLLEELLDSDIDLTLNKILDEDLKANPKISIILKSRGIDQQNVDIINDKPNFTKEYLDNINSTLGIGPTYLEGEFLLRKMEELFMNDGTSNPELISALIKGYKDALINNYEINIQELRSLIEVKTQNIDKFCYIKEENSGYFSNATGSVYCDDATISTLLHETGHALHHYLIDGKIPEKYEEIVEKIKQNTETLNKVEEYSKKFDELYNKMETSVAKKYNEFFDTHFEEERQDIIDFLNKSKEEQKEEFKKLGISEETLEIILDSVFTMEEYLGHQKRMYIKENVDAILRSEFGAYISVGDIIDAIYDGDFKSGILKNEKEEKIQPAYGHGIAYYFARDHGFDEMFANFCMILKSKDCNEVLNLLKDTLGDDLYNMFTQFYHDNILNSNETKLEGQKLL